MIRALAMAGAALTCPCHIVVLTALLGGTPVGAWMKEHTPLLLLVFATLFVALLALAIRYGRAECDSCAGSAPAPQ